MPNSEPLCDCLLMSCYAVKQPNSLLEVAAKRLIPGNANLHPIWPHSWRDGYSRLWHTCACCNLQQLLQVDRLLHLLCQCIYRRVLKLQGTDMAGSPTSVLDLPDQVTGTAHVAWYFACHVNVYCMQVMLLFCTVLLLQFAEA